MSLQWKVDYKIGHDEIDAQHKQLFNIANDLLAATDRAGLTTGAMALYKYTRQHFAHEEQLMKRLNYPAIAGHLVQHDGLISRLNQEAARIASGTVDRDVLEAFLSDWLLNHIATSDTKLAHYIQKAENR